MFNFRNPSLALFFILTFALSWLAWGLVIASGQSYMTFPNILLFLLGGSGPSLAAMLLVYTAGGQSLRGLLRRLFDLRLGAGWWLLVIAIYPLVFAAAHFAAATAGQAPEWELLRLGLAQPAVLIPSIIITLVAGPLSEELGWRGFALDRLQVRLSPVAAVLALGLVWWAWHLPLFWVQGTSHNQWGFGSLSFWLFLANVFPLTAAFAWVYNHTGRSLAGPVLLHFFFNMVLSLAWPLTVTFFAWVTAFNLLAAVVMVLAVRGRPVEQAGHA